MKIIRSFKKYTEAAKMELEALNALKLNDHDGKHRCIRVDKWFEYRGHVCIVQPASCQLPQIPVPQVFDKLGPSLFDFLKKNNYHPFDVRIVRDIGYQLLTAVKFMHSLELIHTDLKPENILFYKAGYDKRSPSVDSISSGLRIPNDSQIRVIDFGSATFVDGHHGRIVSTRHYRAPEVVIGAGWSYGCDLWSVGCILVELITGETLFQTHEDIEHLAMMERLLGPMPKSFTARSDFGSKKLFKDDHTLNWPDGASSRKSIRAVRRLMTIRDWIIDASDKSIRPYLDDFLDLVTSLMRYEPSERPSAKDALNHNFFAAYANGTDEKIET